MQGLHPVSNATDTGQMSTKFNQLSVHRHISADCHRCRTGVHKLQPTFTAQVHKDAGRVLCGGGAAGDGCLVEALCGALLGPPWPLQQPLALLEH